MTRPTFAIGLLVLFVNASMAQAQISASPTRDPRALALIATSLKALAPAAPLSDIRLEATVTYTAGSDEQAGTAALEAIADSASNVTLSLSGGRREEIRNGQAGQWTGSDSTPHAMATHNCWTDAAWFSPALVLQEIANDPTMAVTYAGAGTHSGVPVQEILVWRATSKRGRGLGPVVQRLTTEALYFDGTGLPVALDFTAHPDKDLDVNIAVEIQYGDYQKTAGVLTPTVIRKLVNNSPLLVFNVTAVAANTNLPAGDFVVIAQQP